MKALLTKRDVADLLGVHPTTVMRLARGGQFARPIKLNSSDQGGVRFDPNDVQAGIEVRKARGQNEEASA